MAHSHSHASAAGANSSQLIIVLCLSTILLLELVTGLLTNSLALIADAGHVLSDAAGVGLALLAIWFAAQPATARQTFGYYRMEIPACLADDFDIEHSTFQIETKDRRHHETASHA